MSLAREPAREVIESDHVWLLDGKIWVDQAPPTILKNCQGPLWGYVIRVRKTREIQTILIVLALDWVFSVT